MEEVQPRVCDVGSYGGSGIGARRSLFTDSDWFVESFNDSFIHLHAATISPSDSTQYVAQNHSYELEYRTCNIIITLRTTF